MTQTNRFILLCGPAHDDLTEHTCKLLANFPDLGAPSALRIIRRPIRYDQLLARLGINSNATDVALIFCGHGEPASLQGPGASPGAPDYREVRSSFYDDLLIHVRPRFMLAFCCSAGAGLGDSYERKTTDCTFVGFDTEIGVVKRGGVYTDCWRKILRESAAAMMGGGPDLEELIRQLYRDAIASFSPAGGKKYKWALMTRMYLQRQLDALKVVQS